MKRIALKIDVDTFQGARNGVPMLLDLLNRHQAQGSFFLALGPDRSGCQANADSLKKFYPLSTRLYGRLLPAPNIGSRCSDMFRQIREAGFETGARACNRVAWEEKIADADSSWVTSAMTQTQAGFAQIFGEAPAAFAAPGWRSSRRALRLTQRLGLAYASDCRGNHPFIPVIDGEIVACPQLPTTLPTLDEILALEPGLSAEQGAERIVNLSLAIPGDHVYNMRAELEGMQFCAAGERLLQAWREAGISLIALRDMRIGLEIEELPRHSVIFDRIPGRSGKRMIQGPAFPLEG